MKKNIYIEKIRMQNYGAITNLEYNCQFNENGNPYPIVLVGKNGSGKTLLLSNILHSLIEIKRKLYNEIPEVNGDNLYRLGSKEYIQSNKEFSYINIEYTQDMYYCSCVVRTPKIFDFNKIANYPNINTKNSELKQSGFFNECKNCEKETFDGNIFLYFPVDRYYIPNWLNNKNEYLSFSSSDNYLGHSNTDIIKDNLLEDIESWILDVLIDKYIYEQNVFKGRINGVEVEKIQWLGRNSEIHENINAILRKIFPDCEKYNSVRIGVFPKNNRKISIMACDNNGTDILLSPTFKNLSSGEIMILSMFCSIIREADRISNSSVLNFNEISGIVLIDEIDVHLHSNFAKEILPEVMSLFPKIQFIVSSHSPFFLLGMKQKFDNQCVFLTMPDGTNMKNVENFEEIQRCYEMLDLNHKKLMDDLAIAEHKLSALEKPLIITEGKTDWKHIKNALKYFKDQGKFSTLDVEFWENENDFGDAKLKTMLENIAKINKGHIILGIFDSDDKIGKEHKDIINYGNNVFGICIPDNPNYPNGISIEFLYKDDDIKKKDSFGRRLYLANEFLEKTGRLISDHTIIAKSNKISDFYKTHIVKIVDDKVYNLEEQNIALTKNDFVANIINKTPPFDGIDLTGFIPLLENIQEVIDKN